MGNGLGRLINKHQAECGPVSDGPMQRYITPPTLAQRVAENIEQYEAEIAKLREIATLLEANPEIEKLINALGNANLRY